MNYYQNFNKYFKRWSTIAFSDALFYSQNTQSYLTLLVHLLFDVTYNSVGGTDFFTRSSSSLSYFTKKSSRPNSVGEAIFIYFWQKNCGFFPACFVCFVLFALFVAILRPILAYLFFKLKLSSSWERCCHVPIFHDGSFSNCGDF